MAVLKVSKYSFVCLFLLLSSCFNSVVANSQESKTTISNTSLAEKIYLQLDKDIYTKGSTIWFKSIVTKSVDNTPTDLSSVLHIELINAEETIIEKKLIKLNQGIGNGHFDLPETLQAGTYLIRAYTEWNKNFDSDFFFEKYVQVFSLYDSTTNKEGTSQSELLSTEEKTETTSIINNDIDLQFLPESGELVHGLSSKVGFKALNSFGTGITVEGTVFDDENNQITTFKSNALGMGSFQLDSVNGNKTYHAKLKNTSKIHPLPKATFMGHVLSVVEQDKIITINTSSNYLKNDSIYLNVSFRGTTLHELKAPLKNGTLKFLFSSNELPEGILVFKMMDANKRTVAERLYFNKRLGNDLNLKVATNKSKYSKRELTHLTLETTNDKGESINVNASILVIDKKELGPMQSLRDNILSYFLLSSELKGEIENPGYYLSNNENKEADLDALMLTQGWRHYKYSKPYDKLSFRPETALTVSGTAINKSFTNKDKQVNLTMMTFGKEEVLYTQTTDTLGRFNFTLDDEFGGSLNVLIQSTKKSGKKVNYDFRIDEKKSPIIVFEPKKIIEKPDPIIEKLVEKEVKKARVMDDFYIPEGNIALDEVLLTGRNLNAAQQKVTKRFGEPDIIIDGKELQEKEQRWHSGIYDILYYNFRDKIEIVRTIDGILYAKALNNEPTLIIVDGIPVQLYEYQNLQNIPAEEITSVEVIEYAKSFGMFCSKVIMGRCPGQGNIIAIYTKGQRGIYGAYTRHIKGLSQTMIPIFSESKTFYAPKYDTITAEDLEWPDLRSLIHWEPILKTDNSGKIEISFYNGDITGDMMVIMEVISDNGSIGYQEYSYKVE
ncbi:MG2 domain-containing protein [Confluentibacter lentus]|uniref:MG2 domain-containing protein n=1 Tax=Confluentibacter lentus TaxID=1699412 RepID=UPI0012FD89CC|nr:MG2 domain-containing protein [Confluentibacter lentus]